MPGCVGQRKTSQLALLNCTQPVRGKSPAIQHNRPFCKMQPVAAHGFAWCQHRFAPCGFAEGSVMSCAPARTTAMSVRVAQWVYSGAARKVALIPRPPGGSACGGSHCVARPRLGSLAPVRPKGLPNLNRRVATADFSPLRPVLGGKRCLLQHKLGSILRKIGRIWSSRPSGDHKARYGIGEHVISTPFPWNAARQSSAKRVAFTGSAAGPTTIFFRTLGFNCLQSNSLYLTNS